MPKPQVIVNGVDIYALGKVNEIIALDEFKTFDRDKLIQNNYNIDVKNYDDFFSADNPVSLFAGTNWRYIELIINDEDGNRIWRGVVEDVIRDHENKLATLVTKNSLVKSMDTKIAYVSSDWETAADAAKNILEQEGFEDFNEGSFNISSGQLTTADSKIKCIIRLEDDMTLQQVLEKLAEFGCADCYSHIGNIFYKHWQRFSGGVKINLTVADLESAPIVSADSAGLINDYSIGYDGDANVPATDSANNDLGSVSRSKFGTHSLREMGGSYGSQIRFEKLGAAVYIGEQYMRRTHARFGTANVTPAQVINFSLSLKHREWLDLETFFRLTFAEEGWTNKLFEVYRFIRNFDRDTIDITAYEVDDA